MPGEPVAADAALMPGPAYRDTLASRNNLAIAYQAVGRAAEAIAQQRGLGLAKNGSWARTIPTPWSHGIT